MTPLTWIRHPVPPWERKRGHTAEYAVQLDDEPKGMESTVVVSHVFRPGKRKDKGRNVWAAIWYPAGARGTGMHICIVLFAVRTLKAAQLLVEMWASSGPRKEAS